MKKQTSKIKWCIGGVLLIVGTQLMLSIPTMLQRAIMPVNQPYHATAYEIALSHKSTHWQDVTVYNLTSGESYSYCKAG